MTLMCLKQNFKKKVSCLKMNDEDVDVCVCVCAVGYMMKYVDTVGI